ncbi:hypothetical protein CMV_010186 [Castanea mollissima]|uniref:Uncharacterized protein n=1 Tax=Castanea mollissima TaxID=60419 RepID=A0A8J4RJP2_9ROSI|nr:hypothetical protein CMV_010186 [Castanea mollissima]
MQSESLPVERQILGSCPSLIRSGTTSYSFHSIGTITGTLKGSKREKSKKKNCRHRSLILGNTRLMKIENDTNAGQPKPFSVSDHSLLEFHFLTLGCVGIWLSIAIEASLLCRGSPNPRFGRFKVEICVKEDCDDCQGAL